MLWNVSRVEKAIKKRVTRLIAIIVEAREGLNPPLSTYYYIISVRMRFFNLD